MCDMCDTFARPVAPVDASAKRAVDDYEAKKRAFLNPTDLPAPLGSANRRISSGFNATCVNCGESFNAALQHFCSRTSHLPVVSPANQDIEPVEHDVLKSGQAPGEGGWYSRFNPQPIDIIAAWNLNHWQAEALTYIVRYDMKGGKEDLEKAIWYLNDLIKRKYGDS